MMLARNRGKQYKAVKKSEDSSTSRRKNDRATNLIEFIKKRDFTGAITLLEFRRQAEETSGGGSKVDDAKRSDADIDTLEWLGYCYFHNGDMKRALDSYKLLIQTQGEHRVKKDVYLHMACCLYCLGLYKEAKEEALKSPPVSARNRLLFHVAQKLGDETALMKYHQALTDSTADQLCLAAMHYLRNHHQEATDIYKRLLLENRDDLALNVYVAMCYYKMDYYDVSLELLAVYLQAHPNSAVALNLKACNHFQLYNGKAAMGELKPLIDAGHSAMENELLRHNMVVFGEGKDALRVLPGLVDFLPAARMNLVIYYLQHEEIDEAYDLVKDMEPSTPQEYILKGVVSATIGQANGSREHVKMAQQYFQLVGASASECDTIPGRKCMASCFFLLKQFDDVNIYLKSIKAYLYNSDDFNWNYGISLAATHQYKEAEAIFQLVQSERLKRDYCYMSWLARCYVRNGKPKEAWDLYMTMETSNEAFNLLQLIANDCYEVGAFYYSAKAFDVLERLDPDPEYWEGKRGACIGVFQKVIAKEEKPATLRDVVAMLRKSVKNPQVSYIVGVIQKWCEKNRVDCD